MQKHLLAQTLPPLACKLELEQLIVNSLRRDWVIRIEYGTAVEGVLHWRTWGNSYFAVKGPAVIIDAINACRANNPASAIRLSAEKFNPVTQLNYLIQDTMSTQGHEENALQPVQQVAVRQQHISTLRAGNGRR